MAQRYNTQPVFTDIIRWVRDTSQAINAVFREISETTDNIVAGTTQTQAGATALNLGVNRVSSANTNDGVLLPFSNGGGECVIRNEGGNAIQVWPPSGGTIDGGSANAVDGNTLADASARTYRAISKDDWITVSNT